MQVVLSLLALLIGAALAGPMTILTPDDLDQENGGISSREYLKEIFEGKVSFSDPIRTAEDPFDKYEKIVYSMAYLELFEAITILEEVYLPDLLQDVDLDTITLILPTDKAIKKWHKELPKTLKPSKSDLENLVKAWIIDDVVAAPSTRNNDVRRSINGAPLRFNKYDSPNVPDKQITTVNGATIIKEDKTVPRSKAIIQIVDKVIYPLPTENVVETLVDVPAFSKFIELVKTADLADALSKADPITMFVPTNDALRSLPNIDDLIKNKTKLAEILKYHVIKDARYSSSMIREESILTARGASLSIPPADDEGIIYLNKDRGVSKRAKILAADIPATNGVLHIIDRVLTPPEARYVLV